MAQQSWFERLVDRVSAWLALWVPKNVARHVLMDLAIRANELDPKAGILDMPFERMWDVTFVKKN